MRHGLTLYVKSKLQEHESAYIRKEGCPLLNYACDPEIDTAFTRKIRSDIVALMLQHGADPNERWWDKNHTLCGKRHLARASEIQSSG